MWFYCKILATEYASHISPYIAWLFQHFHAMAASSKSCYSICSAYCCMGENWITFMSCHQWWVCVCVCVRARTPLENPPPLSITSPMYSPSSPWDTNKSNVLALSSFVFVGEAVISISMPAEQTKQCCKPNSCCQVCSNGSWSQHKVPKWTSPRYRGMKTMGPQYHRQWMCLMISMFHL
jgi:hypothetical protein